MSQDTLPETFFSKESNDAFSPTHAPPEKSYPNAANTLQPLSQPGFACHQLTARPIEPVIMLHGRSVANNWSAAQAFYTAL